MSVITEILDRLSGVEVLKEKLRDTASRLEEWAGRAVELDRQVQDVDRRLVRIETLADIAGMSRSSFAAHFTHAFGQTPMSLLRAVRLRRAGELLLTTDTPVAQIAHDVGFVGRSNFSRAFRKMYSVDPTRFRRIAFGAQSE